MIPKVIHYIWLGGKQKPPLVNICILSWKEKLPDYKIIEWNETNLNIDKIARENRFFAECKNRQMWAYMADYLRLKILYEHGGIYMDTDMQVIKSLDFMLEDNLFLGEESSDGVLNCAILGSARNNPYILKVLNYYDEQIWNDNIWTIPLIITKVLLSNDNLSEVSIYPLEYFYPFQYQSEFKEECVTENTYTIHWWSGSWIGNLRPYIFLNTKHIKNPLKKFLISTKKIGPFYYRKYFK